MQKSNPETTKFGFERPLWTFSTSTYAIVEFLKREKLGLMAEVVFWVVFVLMFCTAADILLKAVQQLSP